MSNPASPSDGNQANILATPGTSETSKEKLTTESFMALADDVTSPRPTDFLPLLPTRRPPKTPPETPKQLVIGHNRPVEWLSPDAKLKQENSKNMKIKVKRELDAQEVLRQQQEEAEAEAAAKAAAEAEEAAKAAEAASEAAEKSGGIHSLKELAVPLTSSSSFMEGNETSTENQDGSSSSSSAATTTKTNGDTQKESEQEGGEATAQDNNQNNTMSTGESCTENDDSNDEDGGDDGDDEGENDGSDDKKKKKKKKKTKSPKLKPEPTYEELQKEIPDLPKGYQPLMVSKRGVPMIDPRKIERKKNVDLSAVPTHDPETGKKLSALERLKLFQAGGSSSSTGETPTTTPVAPAKEKVTV